MKKSLVTGDMTHRYSARPARFCPTRRRALRTIPPRAPFD